MQIEDNLQKRENRIIKLANTDHFCGGCGKLCGSVTEEDIKMFGNVCPYNGRHGKILSEIMHSDS